MKWGFVLNSVRSTGTVSDFLNSAYIWKWDANTILVEINPLNSQELNIVSSGENDLSIFEAKGRQLVKIDGGEFSVAVQRNHRKKLFSRLSTN